MRNLVYLIVILFTASCSTFSSWHFPYMMEVKQGNYITEEQFKQLHIGLTKDEVVRIINHPLVEYAFKKDQWDFIYQEYKNNKLVKSYGLSIIFANNRIIAINKSGDQLFLN
jgi:outer membrane protein assembly factor BamE (lipoprotein component of BamABCDE complex)